MHKENTHHSPKIRRRLARIERKCDTILSLLRSRKDATELDRAISLMHMQARLMKTQAMKEAQRFRDTFSSRKPRR